MPHLTKNWGTLSGANISSEIFSAFYRIKRDLTQEQLAEIMGVSQNYVANIEGGKENMSLGKILELSNYLNTDINICCNIT